MAQLEHIEAIEKRLWSAADTLRANSNFAANEFFMPVMGLIFLRHAYSRFLAVKDEVVKSLPSRGGKTRAINKEDFSTKGAVFLRPEAQFDYLVGGYRVRHGYHSKLPQVRQAKLGRTNSGRSYIVKKSTYD